MVNADDVLAYLEAAGVSISREKIRDYLIEITSSEAFLHPAAELAITAALVDAYMNEEGPERSKTSTFMENLQRVETFPHVLFLGVMTLDWPGLADCAAGVVHEKGWNIAFLKGVTLRYQGRDLGVILVGIKVEDAMARDALAAEQETFIRDLRQVSCGGKAKSFLLTRNVRKLEVYSQVIECIERIYEGDSLERIVGEDGETVKFFASRSNAYVLERTVGDLARMVITNFKFVKRVRTSGGLVQIDVANLVTTRERLTGVTVAGFERDISLQLILDSLRKAFPGFVRKFNKEFTTGDGITLYRLEVCDGKGNPADEATLTRIRQTLHLAATRKKVEKANWIESIGGFEHYARAIIPLLVKDFEISGQPQVFIAAGQSNEVMQEFKLIMVLPPATDEDPLSRFFDAIEGVEGLGILSTHPPKLMGEKRVEMLDVSADLGIFSERAQIYALLKQRIGEIVGEFRDFDEGMRRADRQNLQQVQERLPEVDGDLIREFYYHLDDFYRVGAPVDELADLIGLAVTTMEASAAGSGKLEVTSTEAAIDVGNGEKLPTASLMAAAFSADRQCLRPILTKLSGLDCTMSKIAHEGTTVLTFRITKDRRPIPADQLSELTREVAQLAETT